MEKERIKAAVEAILFSSGNAVEIATIAKALEISSNEIEEAVSEMQAEEGRGVEIIELDGALQMCTKKEFYDVLIKLVEVPKNYRLTDIQLETLSIIAYKQPITRLEIEKIRGVSSDFTVNRLIEAGLIEEKGRQDAPGRPVLFGTTQEFLRRFGLANTEELPDINSEKVEMFKMEAEEEIGYKES